MGEFSPSVFSLQPAYPVICLLAWLKVEINLYQIAFRKGICYLITESLAEVFLTRTIYVNNIHRSTLWKH